MAVIPINYERRVVAYFDIIGWRHACTDQQQAEAVARVAQDMQIIATGHTLHGAENDLRPGINESLRLHHIQERLKVQFAAFSDNVAISMSTENLANLL